MTEVYLAERETDGLPIVLKILDSRGKNASQHLVRFIQEYALPSKIVHPHVIRIDDQGFSDEHATPRWNTLSAETCDAFSVRR